MDTKAGTLCNLGGEDGERIVLGMKESGDRYEIMLLWEWSLNLCGKMDTAAVCPKDSGLCSMWSLDCNAPLLQGGSTAWIQQLRVQRTTACAQGVLRSLISPTAGGSAAQGCVF